MPVTHKETKLVKPKFFKQLGFENSLFMCINLAKSNLNSFLAPTKNIR